MLSNIRTLFFKKINILLFIISPLPILFIQFNSINIDLFFIFPIVASISLIISSFIINSKFKIAKILIFMAILSCYGEFFLEIIKKPSISLLAIILFISSIFYLIDYKKNKIKNYEKDIFYSSLILLISIIVILFFDKFYLKPVLIILSLSFIFNFIFYLVVVIKRISKMDIFFIIIMGTILILKLLFLITYFYSILLITISIFISSSYQIKFYKKQQYWWNILLNQPARILITTFLILSLIGTIFLLLPISTYKGYIDLVDALFTSVSAVCVTGLVTLDTGTDFTFWGQLVIIFLIQIGGIGIMSITTIAFHAIGKRLTLKQEYLLSSMINSDHKNLILSFKTILKFTFIVEGLAALFLFFIFYYLNDNLIESIWNAIFTSISAFCNAGFALQSDSLIPYNDNSLILHIVAILIILGGIAPAISLLLPRWIRGKNISIVARITLTTTIVLLFLGTIFILILEWDGVLSNLTIWGKINNAWFQSVTLRTAGFNSVDLSNIKNPTYLIMVTFMFIGGSPGGTAGGIKTTTIAIIFMTFWSNIKDKNNIVVKNRYIHFSTVYRAITIILSGIIIWFLVVLMLELTQQISTKELIFEVTSAIGTVGLSIGGTSLLDEIGKIIIIVAMFIGRIGIVTLFMILNNENNHQPPYYPEEKIYLS